MGNADFATSFKPSHVESRVGPAETRTSVSGRADACVIGEGAAETARRAVPARAAHAGAVHVLQLAHRPDETYTNTADITRGLVRAKMSKNELCNSAPFALVVVSYEYAAKCVGRTVSSSWIYLLFHSIFCENFRSKLAWCVAYRWHTGTRRRCRRP